jgi:hypothetical protein
MNRPLAALSACLLSVTLFAGCSGQTDTSADDPAAAGSPAEKPSAAGTPADEPQPSTQSTAPESGAGAKAPGAGTKYCDLLSSDLAAIFAGAQGAKGVDKVVRYIGRIADTAPAEVRSDWETLQQALAQSKPQLVAGSELQKQLQQGEITRKEAARKFKQITRSMKRLEGPRFQKAGEAVAQHAAAYCGLAPR